MSIFYSIGSSEYELYQAASGDYCVTVSPYGSESRTYIIGSREDALEFILKDYDITS